MKIFREQVHMNVVTGVYWGSRVVSAKQESPIESVSRLYKWSSDSTVIYWKHVSSMVMFRRW